MYQTCHGNLLLFRCLFLLLHIFFAIINLKTMPKRPVNSYSYIRIFPVCSTEVLNFKITVVFKNCAYFLGEHHVQPGRKTCQTDGQGYRGMEDEGRQHLTGAEQLAEGHTQRVSRALPRQERLRRGRVTAGRRASRESNPVRRDQGPDGADQRGRSLHPRD